VVPRANTGGARWRHHVTTEVTAHYVDALTGADGTATAQYFETHWHYPDAYSVTDANLDDEGL
jgi:hypothetical protein